MNIAVAFYHHKKPIRSLKSLIQRASDGLTKLITWGQYSHCEVVIINGNRHGVAHECFSASIRDGGVRKKKMRLYRERWDIVVVSATPSRIRRFYRVNAGMPYDYFGALRFLLPFLRQHPQKYFCSEYCAAALGLPNPAQYSPQSLYQLLTKRN